MQASPDRAQRLSALIRGDLDWIVMKALEKDRTRRYETSNGLAADVHRHLDGQSVHACPPSVAYRLRKAAARHRVALATTVVTTLALVAGIACSTWFAVRMKYARDEAMAAKAELANSEASLRRTLEELRAVALEQAIATTLAGDEKRASAAIDLAERAGASLSWIQVLRAQLEVNQGRYDDAVRGLEAIVRTAKSDEGSRVAAVSLLAFAQLAAGRDPEYLRYAEEVHKLQPQTAEDYLFKSMADVSEDVDLSLRDIASAMEQRVTPVAVFLRGWLSNGEST